MPIHEKTAVVTANGESVVDEGDLFERVSAIIENRKARAVSHVNAEITLMYWEVGYYIKTAVLDGNRAEYGKRIVATLSQQLNKKYGKN
ncbi:MAG: DUF1016 N-terminal domain-containing protein, partial [Clostridiales Family XIII bacterium]|nr:DUF1016 N-terminal domain-containing protein [Clostridiales Family XIII bacterium]